MKYIVVSTGVVAGAILAATTWAASL